MPRKKSEIAGHTHVENQSDAARAEMTATAPLKTATAMPSSPSIEIAGQYDCANQQHLARAETTATASLKTTPDMPSSPHPQPPPDVLELIDLQRRRVQSIKVQSFLDRTCDSFVAHYLGYHSGLPKNEGRALFKQAADLRAGVEKEYKREQKKAGGQQRIEDLEKRAPGSEADGEGDFCGDNRDTFALAVCRPIILNSILSRVGWDQLRKSVEKRMVEIVPQFPVWSRCAEVAGFAELGLAVIVAEAGNDLTAYPHHMHLWKRLGLAPYKGRAMSQYHGKDLTKEEWIAQGYKKERRGRMAGDVGVALFMAKERNGYGVKYAERRAHTALTNPDWTLGHSDNDARRTMLKEFIKDLWGWWQEAARTGDAELRDAAD